MRWALVTLSSPSSPNDLVAIASSSDASGKYSLETPFSSNVAGHFAGGEWRADLNHNQMVAVTNYGQKPTNALLTLHYDGGEKSYEMQQSIQPGDQMWVNIANLIRNRAPDRKGNVLPADLSFGTYEVQDLSPGLGSLLLGNLALDGTFGFQAQPPDPVCCVISDPTWDPDYITFEVLSGFGSTLPVNVNGYNACTGSLQNISPDFFSWWSGNTAVAQVTKQQVKSVGFGTTTGTAEGYVIEGQGSNCVETIVEPSAQIIVGPQITSIVPSTGQVGGSSAVAISGSNFGAGSTVNVTPTGVGVSGVTVSPDGTLINALFTIPAGTTAGPYSVSVSVPSGDGGGSLPSNTVTFTVTACASVTNFQRQSWIAKPTTGELDITYTWGSSTGNQSDLAACQLAEYVTYPGSGGTYTWPRPPFGQVTANPTPGGGNGANSAFVDQHLPPGSWVKPYIAASFQANQTYQYVCPCVSGGNQVQLGQYTITRSVTQNSDGTYKYTVTKSSGESATLNPLP